MIAQSVILGTLGTLARERVIAMISGNLSPVKRYLQFVLFECSGKLGSILLVDP